ncbi:MAG: hypothetical protein NTU99_06485 [Pseudanabaena sp. LacPavin_0818_WC45_MAG_42_6]|nr:hypothetical protein [Pseudanabaena sp. LacPavin_0818_WC45_MAG_42_6]
MLPIIEAVENIATPTVQNPLPDEVLINTIEIEAKMSKISAGLMRADAFPKSNVISDLYSLTNLEPQIYKIFCQISAATKRDK